MFKEDPYTELKREVTDDLKKEIIAFANTEGGKIYIGIDDTGEVVGIEDVDYELTRVTNMIRDAISPDITMFTNYKIEKINNLDVIVIKVESAIRKPYYLIRNGLKPSGVYIRHGISAVPASEDYIKKMILESDGESYEIRRSFYQDLTFNTLELEFKKRNIDFGESQMVTLGIKTQNEKLHTNLGLLLSDQANHTIKAALFQGTDKNVFRDRKEFSGSVLKQLNDVFEYIMQYNKLRGEIIGLNRKDTYDYPEVAIREALLNSVVHRDYSFSGSILVSILEDRIEFVTIGGLVAGIGLEDIFVGISQTRNERLANVFHRLKLVEAYGTGIAKIIKCYSGVGVQPKFEVTSNAFKLTLFNINFSNEMADFNDNEQMVLKYFSSSDRITRQVIEELLGVSQTMAGKILRSMINKKALVKKGGGANTFYIKA